MENIKQKMESGNWMDGRSGRIFLGRTLEILSLRKLYKGQLEVQFGQQVSVA